MSSTPRTPLELVTAAPPAAAPTHGYWRSLGELAQSDEFRAALEKCQTDLDTLPDAISRRRFLALMGASLALAGLTGCYSRPRELILPYVHQPEGQTPGVPQYFATAMPLAGYGSGLLVKSMTGRPIKIEGNPDHPTGKLPDNAPQHAGFGPADVFAQASILSLYDPDRSQSLVNVGALRSWDAFALEINNQLRQRGTNVKLRILTETVTSPSLAWQIERILHRFPEARWHVYEPAGQDNVRIGLRHATGQNVAVKYRFEHARVILSLDADFLACGPGHTRYARDFAAHRQATSSASAMNRLYAVESMPSVTGAKADHRRPMRVSQIVNFARAIATEVGVTNVPAATGEAHGVPAAWLHALGNDLKDNRGASLVLAGEGQPPLVHALAHAMNVALGNVGETVLYTQPVEFRPPGGAETSLAHLVDDMAADPPRIDMLLIIGGNPVYTAPADLHFGDRLMRIPFRAHLSLYNDETSELCHWHVPQAHYLESWGDVRAYDGTVSIIQPLIAPLFRGKTAQEVLDLFQSSPQGSAYDIVRTYWGRVFTVAGGGQPNLTPHFALGDRRPNIGTAFDVWWRQALHDGKIDGTAAPAVSNVSLAGNWGQAPAGAGVGEGLEIVFKTDPTVFDGRFANNGWLQELPKPLSHLTWDNAAFLSPSTAIRLGHSPANNPAQATGKLVTLRYQGREVEASLLVVPGHADDSITVHLGHGRTNAGSVGNGVGFNAYALRTSTAPWFDRGVTLHLRGTTRTLAITQEHFLLEGRDLVRAGTVQHPPHIPDDARAGHEPPTLYANDHPPRQTEYQWAMAIDLTACSGCSACVVACQSENNIPVVGKAQVVAGREMHWLRIDTYYAGTPEHPDQLRTYFEPLPCMHCENAPCELVCPVEATVHSDDGLNDMVYNRCVGTRYCSNNCPYKVRRFNFLQYADFTTDLLRLAYNPDVTVRSRGVMEKCTYCVQRIRHGEVGAAREDRLVRDGEVMTACQSACPTGAITFGDLAHASKVRELRQSQRGFGMLTELNTRPRTTYLVALRNPNPAIESVEGHGHE